MGSDPLRGGFSQRNGHALTSSISGTGVLRPKRRQRIFKQ
jgi:hypothetical protein